MQKRRLSRVILFARDMNTMVAFYRDVIGLRPHPSSVDDESFVTFDVGGCEFCLHKMAGQRRRRSTRPTVRTKAPAKLSFYSPDVEKERASLIARGVRMRSIHRFDGGAFCDGIDVEGNVFQITNR